ncbi:MAG: heme o synthase, partial [Acidimicrobiaceae bacterium]|nr:heme o synthase [Acidimicrobiaceae bacterium]
LAPIVLFAVIFVWTPPHFWALAIRYRSDYVAAEVPMLPAVMSFESTARRIVAYSVVLWATTLLFGAVGGVGVLYWTAAVVLGAIFLVYAVRLYRERTEARAMQLFGWSITYVTLLFAAIAIDQLVHHA